MTYQIEPIGHIQTPFTEKFGIPRQGIALSQIPGKIVFNTPYDDMNAFRGIEAHSHLWIYFLFHANAAATERFSPLVRPPRLGGNTKLGVFATRSSFRPNNLGMTLVKRGELVRQRQQTTLTVYGVDMLHRSPILDIKPYIPYADICPQASSEFAPEAPAEILQVHFSVAAQTHIKACQSMYPDLLGIIQTVLSQDPRPAFHSEAGFTANHPNKTYHIALYDKDVHFQVRDNVAEVIEITD